MHLKTSWRLGRTHLWILARPHPKGVSFSTPSDSYRCTLQPNHWSLSCDPILGSYFGAPTNRRFCSKDTTFELRKESANTKSPGRSEGSREAGSEGMPSKGGKVSDSEDSFIADDSEDDEASLL